MTVIPAAHRFTKAATRAEQSRTIAAMRDDTIRRCQIAADEARIARERELPGEEGE